ncbi:MAG: hypothetical protein ABI602_04700 [Candidatus Saccharibacteria bacterium]
MELTNPIIVQVPLPTPPSRLRRFLNRFHVPGGGLRTSKIITAIATIIISITMTTFVVFSVLSNNAAFTQKHGLTINQQKQPAQTGGFSKSIAALPGGGTASGVGGTTGTNSPVVTLTATPASLSVGGVSKLTWSVTNKPTACTASDDWSGAKDVSGSETTAPLTKVQTYLYTLTCKTPTGTGFSTVSVGATSQSGTGSPTARPTVTLAASPSAIYNGGSSTLNWSTTNSPTSCTASGDWSGLKSPAGPQSTGPLAISKTYTYSLTCTNSAGTGSSTATVRVSDPPPNLPIVTISNNPLGPITPGSAVALSWSTTNSPTSCTASGDWSGAKAASGSENSGPLNSIKTYFFTITCQNASGGTNDTAAVQVLPNAPAVSLTVSPNAMFVGNSATINWSATNSPTSCTASGDWSGLKTASGSVSTGVLNTAKTYFYSLSCTNAGGTGFTNNVALTVSLPPPPVVSISINPISLTSGSSATISWSATNSPTSCTASGDWSGAKAASGTQNTGTLTTVRTYTYSLNCTNAGGGGSSSTSVDVSAGGGGVITPVVAISLSPTSIGSGSSSTLSWSATNNPTSCSASGSWSGSKAAGGTASTGTMGTAGTFTYTLSCSNSAGTGTGTASLTVIAVPVVSISVSPSTITSGSSSTISWSVTGSPTSCTAGGSWTGSKAASGSQTTGTISTAGSYSYSLSCSNSGGTASNSAVLTVNNPVVVYCGGKTPCYGPSDLATRASPGSCWGWNIDWVINITSFRPSHPGGIKSGSTSTIENASATCDHDIHAILAGSASIPGFKDSNGNTTHGHISTTLNNGAGSTLTGYRVGYYDPTKP